MEDIMNIIIVLGLIIVFLPSIVVSVKNGKALNKKTIVKKPRQTTAETFSGPTGKETGHIRQSFRNIENRETDWLASQLREEKANERKFSAMYGLKRAHEENCDARRLRRLHSDNCDAGGVDTGRGM